MAIHKYLRQAWKNRKHNKELWQCRLIEWRSSDSTQRIKHPIRLDRARSLGYKAKKGFVVIRQRVLRGGRKKQGGIKGRRSKRMSRRKNLDLNYQTIAEQRANKKYPNCEVLNSYFLAKDGKHYWYEIILIDRASPEILADKNLSFISKQKGRVYRGLTGSAKKTRTELKRKKG